ncbi:methylated-DNA--[protein]-cysteine S-methyltransferase [Clostridium sp. SM-530-WT-3G]|uniref:methylated-DNA--[protein]-cysteine S-methyltransferase n=1 Tax=Clostridium sp. SM-530-WT-3G TaxID=2725303 RepID=UPI00145DBD83|nr:methylated-DNA--[protein]-cysteine S-methyltransferase [Clostridium sp. SM-530-WT-3G]NME82842.1 methylated-DNA--[protein]-cysteine S-methyltransferase [Clostridium sp. SM-530-WT-3G]
MKYYYTYSTILGDIEIAEEDGYITKLYIRDNIEDDYIKKETELIYEAFKQLDEYLKGERREFELPLKAEGTQFQMSVWDALTKIPYGETRSYKDIAVAINNEKAVRAVGNANNKNPISIFIPCHRVIGTNGKLVGYGGGLDIKEKLLNIEKSK